MKIFENNAVKLGIIAVVVFGLVFGVVSLTENWGKSKDTVNMEASIKKLDKLYNKLSVNKLTPKKGAYTEDEETIAVLPDIAEYPFVVNPTIDNFITIYSSTDKAGVGYNSWLTDVANNFNQKGIVVDGKKVSVGIRAMNSGLGADFISSGKYTPDVYAPSSEIYGAMLGAKGVQVTLLDKSIAGNTTGLVITKKANDVLSKKYGTVDVKDVADSVVNGEFVLGYTNPLANEDGLNFVLALLHSLDANNPTGAKAVEEFRKFQDKVPFVSYDVEQLKDSANAGTLDGLVLNYQEYINSKDLKSSYIFIPIGIRQDQPVYEIGDISPIKKQIANQFVSFCKNNESQKMAADKGFNALSDYTWGNSTPDGSLISQIQDTYKKEKNGTSDLTAVFVADISGSMQGSPLLKLKASLNRASSFIDENTNVGLVTFSDSVNIALPIAKFDSTQKAYFANAVKTMNASGGTAMFDAVVVAEKMLTDAYEKNPNTRLMLFVLTDGESNRGYVFSDIEEISRGVRIPIYTIGYNANIDVLQNLSNINEATTMNAETDNVIYKLESLFNAQM